MEGGSHGLGPFPPLLHVVLENSGQSGFELWPFAATFEEARRSLFRLGPWNAMGFICQGGWADARQKTIAQRRGLEAAPGNLSTVSAGRWIDSAPPNSENTVETQISVS